MFGVFFVLMVKKIIVKMFCIIRILMEILLCRLVILLCFLSIFIVNIVFEKLKVKFINNVFCYVSLLNKGSVIVLSSSMKVLNSVLLIIICNEVGVYI